MSQVKGYTCNSLTQFFFTDKFWMEFSEIPDDRGYVISNLMINYEDNGLLDKKLLHEVKHYSCTQKIKTSED